MRRYKRTSELFNTPLEAGLRSLVILSNTKCVNFDIQRLVFYDYLSVHSGDVDSGPPSLHPAVPHRSGEMLVRRELISRGIDLMVSRQLAEKIYNRKGIHYRASDLASPFLQYFETSYYRTLTEKCRWVCSTFDSHSISELQKYMDGNLDKWGAEFSFEREYTVG